jgi:deoxyribonucleoside regulator
VSESTSLLAVLVQVAHMYYEENLSQQQIADQIGVSRSLVALYLKRARDQGIVHIQIHHPQDSCEDLALLLQNKANLQHVVVVPSASQSAALTRRALAAALARHLENTIQDGDILGIGFGRTIAETADLLAPPKNRKIDLLPLVGESSSGLIGTYSQVNLQVLKIARSFNATPHFLLAPLMVGSCALRDMLLKDEGICAVTGYWQRLTHACIGVGTLPPVTGEVIYIGEENLGDFQSAGGIGDICSRYYDSAGTFIEHPIYQHMIGISPAQLRRAEHILAVASSAEKAAATAGLLRSGLVTDLFVDEDLARALLTRI